ARPVTEAYEAARMPRVIGTRCGVKVIATGRPAACDSTCSTSGTCWWRLTLYAFRFSFTSEKWTPIDSPRPAPDTPDLASTMIVAGSIQPAATAGTRPSSIVVE